MNEPFGLTERGDAGLDILIHDKDYDVSYIAINILYDKIYN